MCIIFKLLLIPKIAFRYIEILIFGSILINIVVFFTELIYALNLKTEIMRNTAVLSIQIMLLQNKIIRNRIVFKMIWNIGKMHTAKIEILIFGSILINIVVFFTELKTDSTLIFNNFVNCLFYYIFINWIDIKTLSEILGHENVNITLNRYVHSSMNLKRESLSGILLQNFFNSSASASVIGISLMEQMLLGSVAITLGKCHILPCLGNINIYLFCNDNINKLLDNISSLAEKTQNDILCVVKMIYAFAETLGYKGNACLLRVIFTFSCPNISLNVFISIPVSTQRVAKLWRIIHKEV